jgi:hypothetical protein
MSPSRTPSTSKDYREDKESFTIFSIKNDDKFLSYPQYNEGYDSYNTLK